MGTLGLRPVQQDGTPVASIAIPDLDGEGKTWPRARAAAKGRSMEGEARAILHDAVVEAP